jgi:preprotein translocase subunit YajC
MLVTFGRMQVQPGMEVVDTAGTPVGEVKEVHDEEFVVGRPTGDDVRFAYSAIRAMLGNQLVLVPQD